MIGIKVTITKYISDEPQPGMVEGKFKDAWANEFIMVAKTAILSSESLGHDSKYPRDGFIACEIVEKWTDEKGRRLVRIDLDSPWGVETIDGLTKFDLEESALIHLS
ncbi:hypothetical protein [Chryseolinea sp. H1M3-3]|uniref:hypothetical protein n=1 Tax=Chryseolinea sp. H1M3-3 TaxID=3034144 RepID=UPI0023EDD32E|nr:hypothetical protein [Chryseolinea sp. H1M3-3]